MTPQIATGSIADSEFLNELRITEAALPQIRSCFRMPVQLRLIKGRSFIKQLGFGGDNEMPL